MKRSYLIGSVLLVVALGGLALYRGRPLELAATHPTRDTAVDAVYATGIVEASHEVRVAPRTAGRLAELLVDEGSVVKRGQILARLEDSDLKASVDEAASKAAYAAAQLERITKLRESSLVSLDALERARADELAARAALQRGREQLGFMLLRAATDGVITRREGEVGEYLPANQALFYLAGHEPLRISADVDEEDLPRLSVGQRAVVRIDAFPGRVFEGRVNEITPRGDPVSRSYRVRLALTDPKSLGMGMTAEVNVIITERKNALLVPASAVIDGAVWVLDGERITRRKVTVGVTAPDRVEILNGLADGDWVVTQPPATIDERTRVKRIPAP